MKLLIVEDYVPLRTSITQLLRENGYAVDDTGDGTEAVDWATKNTYTLAIIDIMLPGMDGLDVLRAIRKAEKSTAVLMITAVKPAKAKKKGKNPPRPSGKSAKTRAA